MKNIYLITEDGERSCIAARTMAEAVNIGLNFYLKERTEEEFSMKERKVPLSPIDIININPNFTQRETEFYHQNILQSCEFIGELKNE